VRLVTGDSIGSLQPANSARNALTGRDSGR